MGHGKWPAERFRENGSGYVPLDQRVNFAPVLMN
jgi:hypothetical protein